VKGVLPLWDELEGDRVHAVPRVLGRKPLTDKDMAKMASARGALDLDPTPIRIRYPPDGALDLLIERRPTAARVELRVRHVERRFATATDVDALNEEIVVLPRKGVFRPLVHDDPRFFGRELIQRSHSASALSGPIAEAQ